MAKTNNPNEGLSVERVQTSPLPLAKNDEHAPLVVDLPDGQKLVVGQMDPGIIIEVATWRGTGRPDSRTNRLMLGITHDDEPSEEVQEAKRRFGRKNIEPPIIDEEKLIAQEIEDERVLVSASSTPPTVPTVPAVPNETYSPSGAVKTGLNLDLLNPRVVRVEFDEKPKREKEKMNVVSAYLKRNSRALSIAAAILAIVFGGGAAAGYSISHPHSGVAISMGSPKSSLIVIKSHPNPAVGDKLIISSPNTHNQQSLVVVQAVTSDVLLVAGEHGFFNANKKEVSGKVVALFPFIGAIASLFGL